MNTTPSKSVIAGWNGTVAGVMALAESLERGKMMELYNEYGNQVFESLEDFCDRMEHKYGSDWIEKFTRK